MFGPTADPGHKVMRALFTLNGNVPRHVAAPESVDGSSAGNGAGPDRMHRELEPDIGPDRGD
jgi:hypothetical protein